MKSAKVVFFENIKKLSESLEQFDIQSFQNKDVPLKLHMGEKGNKYFPPPGMVKQVVETLQNFDVHPFLFDTIVAYNAKRKTKKGYLQVASDHGFTRENMGCDIIIDNSGESIKVDGRDYIVGDHLLDTSHIFALSHVKGHVSTGFGGTIKNFGMGGVLPETKRAMHHGARPIWKMDNCTYCGVCTELCPFGGIKVDKDKKRWIHDPSCFGCGLCVNVCENNALDFKDADLQYRLVCSAKASLQDKKVIYFNEMRRISKGCDCDPNSGPVICPDVGYIVSDDPVAIDQASLDLIDEVEPNVFQKHNYVDPSKQVRYGEKLGLGNRNYKLEEI
ncbi:MAG: DUF362 domain-containing protein [Candidatus Thermoplasmatota archaeon]